MLSPEQNPSSNPDQSSKTNLVDRLKFDNETELGRLYGTVSEFIYQLQNQLEKRPQFSDPRDAYNPHKNPLLKIFDNYILNNLFRLQFVGSNTHEDYALQYAPTVNIPENQKDVYNSTRTTLASLRRSLVFYSLNHLPSKKEPMSLETLLKRVDLASPKNNNDQGRQTQPEFREQYQENLQQAVDQTDLKNQLAAANELSEKDQNQFLTQFSNQEELTPDQELSYFIHELNKALVSSDIIAHIKEEQRHFKPLKAEEIGNFQEYQDKNPGRNLRNTAAYRSWTGNLTTSPMSAPATASA